MNICSSRRPSVAARLTAVASGMRRERAATAATIRTQLINIAAGVGTSEGRTALHLPAQRPWAERWKRLFAAATGKIN